MYLDRVDIKKREEVQLSIPIEEILQKDEIRNFPVKIFFLKFLTGKETGEIGEQEYLDEYDLYYSLTIKKIKMTKIKILCDDHMSKLIKFYY